MTKDEVMNYILSVNVHTDNLFRKTFYKLFGFEPDSRQRLCLADWMKFQQAWIETDAYSNARDAVLLMREEGYDVKIDMQSYKLSYHGMIN